MGLPQRNPLMVGDGDLMPRERAPLHAHGRAAVICVSVMPRGSCPDQITINPHIWCSRGKPDGPPLPYAGGAFDPLRMPRGVGGVGGGIGPTGGGMHVGPGHPFFSDRLRNPGLASGGGGRRGGLGGVMPDGARWDPIAPEGLQGWSPEDFQRGAPAGRGGPPVHPDMMQPGPGRGADWDHMFG